MTAPAKWRQDARMTPTSPAASAIDVAVVEDDAACRIALVAAPNAAPDMRLLWAAATRAEALAALGDRMAQAPDVLLVDLGPAGRQRAGGDRRRTSALASVCAHGVHHLWR